MRAGDGIAVSMLSLAARYCHLIRGCETKNHIAENCDMANEYESQWCIVAFPNQLLAAAKRFATSFQLMTLKKAAT